MWWTHFDFWKILAGLGLFIYGMFLLEDSIKKIAGRSFKIFIREYTSTTFKSLLSGVLVTAVLQSSSAVTLMILAFVGAGIMNMSNAIGVILGSNIGTTFTGWIVAELGFKFSIENLALPVVGIGGILLIIFSQQNKITGIAKFLIGFGLLFLGLNYMKTGVEEFTQSVDISKIPHYGFVVYFMGGIIITAIMQSSSAMMVITMTALNAGMIKFNAAAAIIIGADIGTTGTVILGAIGGSVVKKQVAYSHFFFNIFTAIFALIYLPFFVFGIRHFSSLPENDIITLVIFHTSFNILGVLAFLPFIKQFVLLLNLWIKKEDDTPTRFINSSTIIIPEAAIPAMKKETDRLLMLVMRHNLRVLHIPEEKLFSPEEIQQFPGGKNIQKQKDQYNYLKLLEASVLSFSSKLELESINEKDAAQLHQYLHAARMLMHAAKTFKDIKHNFDEFENTENDFLHQQRQVSAARLLHTYKGVLAIITNKTEKDHAVALFELVARVNQEDKDFLQQTTVAIQQGSIREIEISTAIMVNRAFAQSSRQLLIGISDLVLSEEEHKRFEQFEEIREDLLENE